MKNRIFFLLIATLLFGVIRPYAQNSLKTFECKEIGWTIKSFKGWRILTVHELDSINRKNLKAAENAFNDEIDLSPQKYIVGFELNRSNRFLATIEKMSSNENYEQKMAYSYKEMYNTFINMNLGVDTTITRKSINSHEFSICSLNIS